MSTLGTQVKLLAQLERVSARESRVRECLLRLRAIAQRAQQIESVSPQAWIGVVEQRQETIDRIGVLGWPPHERDAVILSAAARSRDARVRQATAQARKMTAANMALLAEIIELDTCVERRLAEQMGGLAEKLARAARSKRIQTAYGTHGRSSPKFLDRRR